ncbi:glycerate kinase [Oscillospiraceae bacterium 38-13]
MKIIVAIDSFKGSLTSLEAGQAARQGILQAIPHADVLVRPLADGGEGTVETMALGMNGRRESISVTGPLGEPVVCTYGILETSKTAVIEMTGAAGITLLPEQKRNPMHTTTYGVGEVIQDAIFKGCRHFIIGIGGSATNDGGTGMLQALGFGILDKNRRQVPFGAKGLKDIAVITDAHVIPELKDCFFRIACDVSNPLCGAQGCSAIFGLQKGATPAMIAEMDDWLNHFAALTKEKNPTADAETCGAGAAGGLGFAFLSYTKAVLESGVNIVLEETRLEESIREADIVVTGEGRLDSQTAMGKAPAGVAKIAKKYGKTVIAFSGCVTKEASICNRYGIDAFFPILRNTVSLQEAMDREYACDNMVATVEQVFRLIKAVR